MPSFAQANNSSKKYLVVRAHATSLSSLVLCAFFFSSCITTVICTHSGFLGSHSPLLALSVHFQLCIIFLFSVIACTSIFSLYPTLPYPTLDHLALFVPYFRLAILYPPTEYPTLSSAVASTLFSYLSFPPPPSSVGSVVLSHRITLCPHHAAVPTSTHILHLFLLSHIFYFGRSHDLSRFLSPRPSRYGTHTRFPTSFVASVRPCV